MGNRESTGSKAPMATDAALEATAQLEGRLRLPLHDPRLALAALTHKSYVNEHRGEGLTDNERLEFLGDAVIDLAVSHRLMERFPGAREGDLSKIRASLVDESGLAAIARQLDLGPLLRLGRGEEITGGREKASLLADAFEAVIAALYLGDGLRPVLALIDRLLGDAFARAAAGTLDRDYKTQLQELSQSRLRSTPRYRVVAEHGPDHSKTFEVELEVKGEPLGRGKGRSKKDAEQAAAKLGLEALGMRFAAEAAAKETALESAAQAAAASVEPGGAGAAGETVVVASSAVLLATPPGDDGAEGGGEAEAAGEREVASEAEAAGGADAASAAEAPREAEAPGETDRSGAAETSPDDAAPAPATSGARPLARPKPRPRRRPRSAKARRSPRKATPAKSKGKRKKAVTVSKRPARGGGTKRVR